MKVLTEPGNGTGIYDWFVKAHWHGALRIVFTGDVYEFCLFATQPSTEKDEPQHHKGEQGADPMTPDIDQEGSQDG